MTKKLIDLFDLEADEKERYSVPILDSSTEITQNALSNLEKIEQSLTQVRGLEMADSELDELANIALSSFKDLQDLGMQVDSRFASEIFNSASNMLGHAITAKTAKINKKLKMIELQLKKAKLDQSDIGKQKELDNTLLGEGKVLDRNEILKLLISKNKESE